MWHSTQLSAAQPLLLHSKGQSYREMRSAACNLAFPRLRVYDSPFFSATCHFTFNPFFYILMAHKVSYKDQCTQHMTYMHEMST